MVRFSAHALGVCIAATAWPVAGETLTLSDAIARAVASNPSLTSSRFAIDAATARVDAAALRPRAELRLDFENFAGSGAVRDADALETTLTLSQVVELGGVRNRRIDVAQVERDLALSARDVRALDLLAEVTRRFVEVAADERRLELARQRREQATLAAMAAEARVRAGRSPKVESLRAQVARRQGEIEEEHAEHELAAARRKLAALWGATEPGFTTTRADLLTLPRLESFESAVAALERNPAFAQLATRERLREAELRLATSRRAGNVSVGAGVRRLEATGDEALVASLSVPLFTRRAAQPAVAIATAERNVAEAETRGARIDAQAQLFEVYQELRHAITEATALRTEVIPHLEDARSQANYAYERGRYSYLELADVQRELISARRRLVDVSADAHLLAAEIERLTAAPIVQSPAK